MHLSWDEIVSDNVIQLVTLCVSVQEPLVTAISDQYCLNEVSIVIILSNRAVNNIVVC